MKMNRASKIYTALIFLFLFAPIAILLLFSFNESKSLSVFSGFSLKWYQELFRDRDTLESVKNTLILACSASAIATVMGTAASLGINKLRNKYLRASMDTVTNIPMTNPDIITGISLMLMFVFIGTRLGKSASLSFWTLLISHVTFCLPYVILQVLPKLRQMDPAMPEAAMDLGCTPLQAFFKAVLPEIMPGIVTGMIMAFTMSLDDFVISYFTQGSGFQTLPIRIYSMTKKTVTPKMYALATIIFFVILAMLLISNLSDEDDKNARSSRRRKEAARQNARARKARRILVPAAAGVIFTVMILLIITGSGRTKTLNVYNWGEYISDGSEGSLDTVAEFEKWYEETYGQPVKVNYDTFSANEDMYAKLSSGAVAYDLIIPSDYMIARLLQEDMLLPLNYSNIPNFQYITEDFRNLYYDPENRYTVPYTYGVVGVIYNANAVDEADTGDWDLLWNEKYANRILQFNNPRDAFGTAMYMLDLDVNTTDKTHWDQAQKALLKQRPTVSLVTDEIFNLMASGEAAVGTYYAGDSFTMVDNQADTVDLQFYYPQRTNYFVDAMCIPKTCQDQELAECFINFMLSREVAVANAEYIYYATPNSLVLEDEGYLEDMGEDVLAILYPDRGSFSENYNAYAYRTLDPETQAYMTALWEEVKLN